MLDSRDVANKHLDKVLYGKIGKEIEQRIAFETLIEGGQGFQWATSP